jgi:hypothetical protein
MVNLSMGCGAMFNSNTTTVPVRVAPAVQARVHVDGRYVGESPVSLELSSSQSHTIDIEADGFERQSTRIEASTSGGYVALDCVLVVFFVVPGIIALAVDGGSGDWKVLEERELSIQLVPSREPAPSASGGTPSRCQHNDQCSGERVCKEGQCADPAPASRSGDPK